jgi:hypothetical protein
MTLRQVVTRPWQARLALAAVLGAGGAVVARSAVQVYIELPQTVTLKVIETEPGIKGATAAAQTKPATLETGLKIQVPSFIAEGELIVVQTEDAKYLRRAKE